MEVHPPHNGIHSWRDFAIHLVVVTLGLLIALGLDGLVERIHDWHLLHTAESNLRVELEANRKLLAEDIRSLDAAQTQAETNLTVLSHHADKSRTTGELKFYWEWSGPSSAAWDTTRGTGAVALMKYELAQHYFDTYTQQALVTAEASTYVRDVYKTAAPLQGGHRLEELKPAEIDAMIANVQQTMVDLKFLRDLSESLLRDYEKMSAEQ